jgi:Cdc6-like AAA superfamily ATPase
MNFKESALVTHKTATKREKAFPFYSRGSSEPCMTLDDLENDEVFSAAIKGLSKIVELISIIPDEKRSLALAAASQTYLRTAQELGYNESDAQQWASAVISLIEIATVTSELASAKMTAIDETKRISNSLREGQIIRPTITADAIS